MSQQAAEHPPSSSPAAVPNPSGAPKKKRNYYRKKRKPQAQQALAPETSGDESSGAEPTPERSPSAVPRKRRPRKRKNPAARAAGTPTQPQDIPSGSDSDDDTGSEGSSGSPVPRGALSGSPSQVRSQGGKWRDQAAASGGKPQHFRSRQPKRGNQNPHKPVEDSERDAQPGAPNRGGKRFQHNQHKPHNPHQNPDQESSGREQHFKHNERNKHQGKREAPSPSPSGGKKSRKQKLYFEEFLPLEEVQKRLADKTLFQGQFRVNPYRRNESYVTVEGEPVDLKIEGARDTNRALHLDTVVVEIIPKPKGKNNKQDSKKDSNNNNHKQDSKQEKKLSHKKNSHPETDTSDLDTDTATATDLTDLTDITDLDTDPESSGDFSEDENPTAASDEKSGGRKYARVVYVLERNSAKQYIGTLQSFSGKGSQLTLGDRIALFVPCDNKIPLVQVDLAKLSSRSGVFTPDQPIVDQLNGNFFMCEIKFDTWKTTQRIPRGKLLQSIGPCCEVSGQYRALKLAHGITHTDQFPDRILDNEFDLSDKEEWHIPESEFQQRHDLREQLIFTVDPKTAKDLDDALSCEPLPDGNFKVGVHIADVSYFVKLNSPLDKEALFRSTTVYFVTENIPMLPRILCDKLCSLQPRVDRLCFSVQWVLNPEGEIISTEFFRSIIRSAAQLSYETAQQMIDSPEDFQNDEVLARCAKALGFMNQMAVHMKTARYATGSLSLDTPELSFTLDENNQVLDVQQYVRGPSHFLVEEFMLLANQSVAEKIFATFPNGSLLRKHEPPDEEKLKELVKDCTRLGIPLKANSSKELHDCLEDVLTHRGQFIMTALMKLAIKPMKLAKYCCTNSNLSAESYRHYSLNFPLYTHFTSPIRRYADLVVHRLLGASLTETPRLPYPGLNVIEKICEQSNTRKTNADRASRQCDQLYMNLFVHSRPSGVVRTGVVLELSQAHVQIYIPSLDFDEVVRFSKKEQDFTAKWRETDRQVVLTWAKTESLPQCTLTLQVLTELQVQVVPVTERKFMSAGLKILRPAQDSNSTTAVAGKAPI